MADILSKRKRLPFWEWLVIFLAVLAAFAVAFMFLWNVLMPDLFGLPALNYGQAVGLLVLARMLFSGIPGGGFRRDKGFHARPRPDANALRERWANMSGEERRAFVEMGREMRGRWANMSGEERRAFVAMGREMRERFFSARR